MRAQVFARSDEFKRAVLRVVGRCDMLLYLRNSLLKISFWMKDSKTGFAIVIIFIRY